MYTTTEKTWGRKKNKNNKLVCVCTRGKKRKAQMVLKYVHESDKDPCGLWGKVDELDCVDLVARDWTMSWFHLRRRVLTSIAVDDVSSGS